MKAKITDVSFSALDNTALITLKTHDKHAVDTLLELNAKVRQGGKEWLTVDIKPYKSKRSVEQNRLMWELLSILAERVHGRKDTELVWETYIEMLERTGQKFDYFWLLPEAAERLRQTFRASVLIDDNGRQQMWKCFYGSSTFNTAEMTAFIDSINAELKELGVEIL